jgi:hypothetical protein
MSKYLSPILATVGGLVSVRCAVLKRPLTIVVLAFLMFLSARAAAAQGVAEYGLAVAGVGANVTAITKKIDSAMPTAKPLASTLPADKKSGTAAPMVEAPDAANRRALEKLAGKDAAKLTLKSVPAKASVRIDGKPVGETPLLLALAPGAHNVEMEGPRMELGKKQVDLHPQEAREVELVLSPAPLYPTYIQLH